MISFAYDHSRSTRVLTSILATLTLISCPIVLVSAADTEVTDTLTSSSSATALSPKKHIALNPKVQWGQRSDTLFITIQTPKCDGDDDAWFTKPNITSTSLAFECSVAGTVGSVAATIVD